MSSAISKAVDEYFERVAPENIKSLAGKCRGDLYQGPLYFDADGEIVTMWDDGAKQFDFVGAVDQLSEWFNDTPTLYFVAWVPEITCDPGADNWDDPEVSEIDPRCLAELMFGRELGNHI